MRGGSAPLLGGGLVTGGRHRRQLLQRAELVDEFTDLHSTALESLLAALRAKHLDDGAARQTATRLAADALVDLRTSTDHMRTLGEEPVTTAFQRLRDDLRPLDLRGRLGLRLRRGLGLRGRCGLRLRGRRGLGGLGLRGRSGLRLRGDQLPRRRGFSQVK